MTSTLSALTSIVAKAPVPFTQAAASRNMYTQHGTSPVLSIKAMESDGVLFAVVAKIAESLAGVQWRLYRKSSQRVPASQRTEVTQHLALKVWNKPNPFMSRQRLVEAFSQHQALVGEAWLIVVRGTPGGPPKELWTVRPDRMRPIEDPEEFISAYEYTGPTGERIIIPREDVIFMMRPNPHDPYRGIGPVQSVMSHIDAARYSAEWNRQFFFNSAEPSGVLSTESALSDQAFNRLNSQWNEQHKGVAASHRVAILENGLTWTPRTYTRRDMQFAELMEVGDAKILKAFAFPKFMLGSVDDVNRANAEASEFVFSRWTLVPALERIKDCLNTVFLPMFGSAGESVEFDYDSPVPEFSEAADQSLATRSRAAFDLVTAGYYAPDVREALSLPEMSFGEPDADQERQLLIELLKGAPAALAPILLPLLGITPPPPPAPEPVAAPPAVETGDDSVSPPKEVEEVDPPEEGDEEVNGG